MATLVFGLERKIEQFAPFFVTKVVDAFILFIRINDAWRFSVELCSYTFALCGYLRIFLQLRFYVKSILQMHPAVSLKLHSKIATMISRKIWMAENSSHFHTVTCPIETPTSTKWKLVYANEFCVCPSFAFISLTAKMASKMNIFEKWLSVALSLIWNVLAKKM